MITPLTLDELFATNRRHVTEQLLSAMNAVGRSPGIDLHTASGPAIRDCAHDLFGTPKPDGVSSSQLSVRDGSGRLQANPEHRRAAHPALANRDIHMHTATRALSFAVELAAGESAAGESLSGFTMLTLCANRAARVLARTGYEDFMLAVIETTAETQQLDGVLPAGTLVLAMVHHDSGEVVGYYGDAAITLTWNQYKSIS